MIENFFFIISVSINLLVLFVNYRVGKFVGTTETRLRAIEQSLNELKRERKQQR